MLLVPYQVEWVEAIGMGQSHKLPGTKSWKDVKKINSILKCTWDHTRSQWISLSSDVTHWINDIINYLHCHFLHQLKLPNDLQRQTPQKSNYWYASISVLYQFKDLNFSSEYLQTVERVIFIIFSMIHLVYSQSQLFKYCLHGANLAQTYKLLVMKLVVVSS